MTPRASDSQKRQNMKNNVILDAPFKSKAVINSNKINVKYFEIRNVKIIIMLLGMFPSFGGWVYMA